MVIPQSFSQFDVDDATVTVWLFKKSTGAGGAPKFTGRWIDTNQDLDEALKAAVVQARAGITETIEYGLLAQNNEASALQIDADETHAALLVQQAAEEITAKKVTKTKEIQNTDFYAIKLVSGDDVLYAVTKADSSWRSRTIKDAIYAFFQDDKLGLDETPSMKISKYVDFFIVDGKILITNKTHFESVLSYKQAHADDFVALQGEADFSEIFTSMDPLVAFVGTNKIHLRRACAIRVKGHYKDPAFMSKLRATHAQCGLILQFDAAGRIVPTPETCADIVRALLDHRLLSPFSDNLYDVPDATVVN